MSAVKPVSPPLRELEARLAARMREAETGNAEAYRELLREVRDVLVGYFARHLARYRLNDSALADDLVQETLLGIHRKRGTYDPREPFTPWMYAIARYKLIDLARRRKHVHLEDELESVDQVLSIFPEAPDAAAGHDLAILLEGLTPVQRQALELTKLQGLSVAEVAVKMGLSVSAVKVTVHRAIKSLQKKSRLEGDISHAE